MIALLVFAATLLVAVFLSEIARRSVLSTAVLFLFAGFIAGTGCNQASPNADRIFHLIAIVVVASIMAHSSTDVLVSRWLYGHKPEGARA